MSFMKEIQKILSHRHYITFIDFEGTERTQEIIAIGAVIASLNKDGTIKKMKKPFHIYVKANSRVGNYVSNLTGITDEILKEKGVFFKEAMEELKKYCGLAFKKSLFVSYSNSDMRFLNQTIARNLKWPVEICHQIQKNYFDFANFFDNFVLDENGNRISLMKACQLFEITLAEPLHDPAMDALNLAYLYDAFLKRKDILCREYESVILRYSKMPRPLLVLFKMISEGKSVDISDLREEIEKDLE
ncbi:MAG: hypothetical protein IJQ67_02625 [Bacilli bacterium]|nr:hypothetical protein [Bacilli bacterium]